MTTPHRNNYYDSDGNRRSTLLIKKKTKVLDKVRALVTKIDLELIEEKPDKNRINKLAVKIIVQLGKVMR